jgi:hypothetical protein
VLAKSVRIGPQTTARFAPAIDLIDKNLFSASFFLLKNPIYQTPTLGNLRPHSRAEYSDIVWGLMLRRRVLSD